MNRLHLLPLLPLSLLLRADSCVEDGFGFGLPPPSTAETTTTKKLTLHLDASRPAQRFLVPVSMTPPSSSAHVDVVVGRTTDTIRLEIANEGFASSEPGAWTPVSTGFAGSVFLGQLTAQNVILSVGLDVVDAGGVDVDLDVVFACPNDVDFDGLSDDVALAIDHLEPLP